ncbi:MAG: hypothetical protein ABW221_17115 [Vicinamibacteria bacterium]
MTFGLYLVSSARVPEQHLKDEDALLMIDTGFEGLPEDAEIPPEQMRFATTLTVCSDDVDALLQEAREHWQTHAGAPLETELLTSEARLLSEDSRQTLAELAPESWSYRASFLAFRAGSEDAWNDAREFLRDAALVTS